MGTFTARALLKRPGTSMLAVVALGLGIGLTTTMFSIIDGVFLRGLPFERADRIMAVGSYSRKQAGTPRPGNLPAADYLDLAAAQRSFEGLAATSTHFDRGDLIGPDGVPLRHEAARLTSNALRVLRVNPILGRGFTDEDARPGAAPVVLISETVWAAQFQRDPDIVGKTIRAGGGFARSENADWELATIVGVMPESFGFPENQRVWFPLPIHALAAPGTDNNGVAVFGRLRDGVSVAEANVELAAVAARLETAAPENKDRGIAAVPYVERMVPTRTVATFYTMLAAVFGVLLIACVNVANLQLARAADRAREVAIRLALGASRARVIRALLFEGLLLASAGALVGLAIARIALTLVWLGINDPSLPFWIRFEIDGRVLLFATALTMFAAVTATLVPALRASRTAPNDVLKDEGRGLTSLRLGRFSRALVVVQIAFSCALLMASGLAIKSIVKASTLSLPFRTDVLTARLDLSGPAYKSDDALREVLGRIRQRVASIPGVSGVTFANTVPTMGATEYVEIEGQPPPDSQQIQPHGYMVTVGPDYFELMRLPVLQGRGFAPSDHGRAEFVAVVSQGFATRYFPNEMPLGRRFRIGQPRPKAAPAPWRTIVGVVPALESRSSNGRPFDATAFVPLDQRLARSLDVVAAGATDEVPQAGTLRRAIADVDDRIVVDRIATIAGRNDERVKVQRTLGVLFSAFGAAALLLAGVGLYGVMAFAVSRRTAEIGIRMALGADRWRILRMVLRQGTTMLGFGVVLGAGLGLLLTTQLTQLLQDAEPWDAPVLITTVAVLVLFGVAASFVPARRAASVDPLVALRNE